MGATINESVENYLETILVLSRKLPHVRATDIANELSFTKPSVSVGMKNLKSKNLIVVSEEGHITLTPEGLAIAEKIYERHSIISQVFINLGVDEETALEDACKIEHVISETTFAAIKRHISEKGE